MEAHGNKPYFTVYSVLYSIFIEAQGSKPYFTVYSVRCTVQYMSEAQGYKPYFTVYIKRMVDFKPST